jgi:hypothetical protein
MNKLLGCCVVAAAMACAIAGHAQSTDPAIAKGMAEAQLAKAQAEAKTAQLTYANAAGPAAAQTGKVDVKTNAGQIEADVLMAQSLSPIATKIIEGIKGKASGKPIVVFAGTDGQPLARWEMFHFRTARIEEQFGLLAARKKNLDDRYDGLTNKIHIAEYSNFVSAVTGITPGLAAVSKVLSYFASDYEVGGITVATDDTLLVAAIASQPDGLQLYLPSRLMKVGAGDEIYAIVARLDESSQLAQTWVAGGKKRSADLNELAKKDKERADALTALAKDYDVFVDDCGKVIASRDALMATLASTDDKNPMPFSAVVQEKAISDAMGPDGFGLFVHMHSAAGGDFTKKNLWTYLGGMPFYVSGGAVASYFLIGRADGRVAAGGVVAFECGYRKATEVATKNPETTCHIK